MVKTNTWRGARYRGTRGPGAGLLLILILAAAAAAAAGWFFWSRPEPEPEAAQPEPAPIQTQPQPEPEEPSASPLPPAPDAVRGIYISGPVAGDPYMETLLALIDETELNAVVIDVKNDEGNLTYRPEAGTAVEIGACVRYISDLPALLTVLKEHGVYTIARVAAFKDPVLAQARPELALHYLDGSAVSESGTLAWVNPYEHEVWDYLAEIALDAAAAGFDEVQFDYVRFPAVSDMDQVDYGPSAGELTRSDVVAGFLEEVTSSLHDQGVRVSADVFGTVITNQIDANMIGQDYVRLAGIVDCICPMVYPSHYSAGSFGLDVPDRQPYETVYAAMARSAASLSSLEPGHSARPWLQDFTATWVTGHIDYGAEELRAQIQAVYDAGCTDWLLWNAKNSYTADGLLLGE